MKMILIFCLIGFFNQGSCENAKDGKTEILSPILTRATEVLVTPEDVLTVIGKQFDDSSEKVKTSTESALNIFRFLEKCGIPVALKKQVSNTQFLFLKCAIIPFEVEIRREAYGSCLKRNPLLKKGDVFPKLNIDFFLKMVDSIGENSSFSKDNPFIVFTDDSMQLYNPSFPVISKDPFLVLDEYPFKENQEFFKRMRKMAKQTFLVLEKAYQNLGEKLIDLKLEFGIDAEGNLLVSDLVANDCCVLVKNKKQEGADKNTVCGFEKCRHFQKKTREFRIPEQQIILWRSSATDDVQPFIEEVKRLAPEHLKIKLITCCVHTDPLRSYQELIENIQNIPDSVIVAYSNIAGPMLSANTVTPIITVPITWKEFPDDIWSSLRFPSHVPVMTVLEQKNAALAAIRILAKNNPYLYARMLDGD